MTSDYQKLDLKERLEEQIEFLNEYTEKDLPEYPGWTFLLNAVVKAYGVCPFLNVIDDDSKRQRISWLEGQFDKGDTYQKIVKEIVNDEECEELKNESLDLKSKIANHVQQKMQDVVLPDDLSHDLLLEIVRQKKESKSQNKKIKDLWNLCVQCFNFIIQTLGFDFSKYVHVVDGFVVRYKPPNNLNATVDIEFITLYEKYTAVCAKLHHVKMNRDNDKRQAEIQLYNLIKQEFKIDQIGRYFKKWSILSTEKRNDRIKSYCDWYMRQQNRTMDLSDIMKQFIIDKLETKELRTTDIKWDSKLGIITLINVCINDEDDYEEEVSFIIGKRAPRVLKPRRSSRKKKDQWWSTTLHVDLVTRLNRLLLFEVMKAQTLNKEMIVKTVLSNLRNRSLQHHQLSDYVNSKLDDMISVIIANPMPKP